MPKKCFEFEPFDGLVDVYVDGKKVRYGHNGNRGHIFFPLNSDEHTVTVEPADPRVGIDAEIKDGELVPFKKVHTPHVKPPTPTMAPQVARPASAEVKRSE